MAAQLCLSLEEPEQPGSWSQRGPATPALWRPVRGRRQSPPARGDPSPSQSEGLAEPVLVGKTPPREMARAEAGALGVHELLTDTVSQGWLLPTSEPQFTSLCGRLLPLSPTGVAAGVGREGSELSQPTSDAHALPQPPSASLPPALTLDPRAEQWALFQKPGAWWGWNPQDPSSEGGSPSDCVREPACACAPRRFPFPAPSWLPSFLPSRGRRLQCTQVSS